MASEGHREAEVKKDEETDKVASAHLTTVVTDPESDEAVQIPDVPTVDATKADPLGVHNEPSPNEAGPEDAVAAYDEEGERSEPEPDESEEED